MPTIGIRELGQHTSRIIRRIEERGETIAITRHGETVAILIPPQKSVPETNLTALFQEMDNLIGEISADMPPVVDVQDIMNELRRE